MFFAFQKCLYDSRASFDDNGSNDSHDCDSKRAGLVILCVLLLPHLQGGPLVAVVAMMPIICLVAAIGSLDGLHLGGQMTI